MLNFYKQINKLFSFDKKIGTLFNVPIFINWSIVILPLIIVLLNLLLNQYEKIFKNLLFVLFAYLFVILHEFGHIFASNFFDIKCKRILLHSFGGLVELESKPLHGIKEVIIAAAGPIVNLYCALISIILGAIFNPNWVIELIFTINFLLVIFNLLPIYPLDGACILRGFLTTKLPIEEANKILLHVSYGTFLGFFVTNMFYDFTSSLALIIIFVLVILPSTKELLLRS